MEHQSDLVTGNDFSKLKHPETKLTIEEFKTAKVFKEMDTKSRYDKSSTADACRWIRNDVVHYEGDLSWYDQLMPNRYAAMIRFLSKYQDSLNLEVLKKLDKFWFNDTFADLELDDCAPVSPPPIKAEEPVAKSDAEKEMNEAVEEMKGILKSLDKKPGQKETREQLKKLKNQKKTNILDVCVTSIL